MRQTMNEFFMDMAYKYSTLSTCLRRQVGAVIVRDNREVSAGYNGAPPKIKHCTPKTCIRAKLNIPSGERQELCRGGHAEQNAIANAAANGIATRGTILYCTTYPCAYCAKAIARAEISKVIYDQGYPDPISEEMLANIEVVKYSDLFK